MNFHRANKKYMFEGCPEETLREWALGLQFFCFCPYYYPEYWPPGDA